MKWLNFAWKNVLRNRRRSFITILIAAVGATGVLVGGGFALFTYDSLQEMAARESGHLTLAHKSYFESDEDTPMQYGLADFAAVQKSLEKEPRIRMALPRVHFSGLLSNGDKSSVFVGMGIDPAGEFYAKGPAMRVLHGTTLTPAQRLGEPPEIMLGVELARQMKATPGALLTLLSTTTSGSLNALDVKVCGIMSVGTPEIDKRLLYVDVATAQRLLVTDKVSTLSVYLRETAQTDEMQKQLAAGYPHYTVRTWRDQAQYYAAVRSLYNRIFGLLGVVIVVMVTFAVSNTLAMAVVERTREIGTLRAMGTLPAQIERIFALEGLVLGAVGSALGMLVALSVSIFLMFADVQMPPPPGRSVGYPLQINISPELYLLTMLVVISLSVAAAWLVSRKMAAKSIVEALTHV